MPAATNGRALLRKPLVETISDDELAYHQRMIAKVNHDMEVARAPLLLWNQHLVERYGLGPTDTVDEGGQILRGPVLVESFGIEEEQT